MTLVDAGPLIALLDRDDPDHRACAKAVDACRLPLVTTLPAFTEAVYLLGARAPRGRAWRFQERLWLLVDSQRLTIHPTPVEMLPRARDLMHKYADVPMDFADATLVALAEALNQTRVFTLDRHFRTYRLLGRRAFELVP